MDADKPAVFLAFFQNDDRGHIIDCVGIGQVPVGLNINALESHNIAQGRRKIPDNALLNRALRTPVRIELEHGDARPGMRCRTGTRWRGTLHGFKPAARCWTPH